MNRRQALLAGLASAGTLGAAVESRGDGLIHGLGEIPGAIPLKVGQAIDLKVVSNPIKYKGQTFSLLSIGRGIFELDAASHLTAKLHAGVLQCAKIDYWISVAVFDAAGKLLGTASHKEEVQRIELGKPVTEFRDIALDFGISKTYANAASVVVAISERDVPAPEGRVENGK